MEDLETENPSRILAREINHFIKNYAANFPLTSAELLLTLCLLLQTFCLSIEYTEEQFKHIMEALVNSYKE